MNNRPASAAYTVAKRYSAIIHPGRPLSPMVIPRRGPGNIVLNMDSELRFLRLAISTYLVFIVPTVDEVVKMVFEATAMDGDWELNLADEVSELVNEASGTDIEDDFHRFASIILDFGQKTYSRIRHLLPHGDGLFQYHLIAVGPDYLVIGSNY